MLLWAGYAQDMNSGAPPPMGAEQQSSTAAAEEEATGEQLM